MDSSKLIFEIENSKEILDFTSTDGTPLWMIARWYLLHDVVGGRLLRYSTPMRMRKIEINMFKNILNTCFYNIFHKKIFKDKEIIFYATNRKTIINGEFCNRYVDFFNSVYPEQSVVIEQALLNWEWPFPRINNQVYFDTISRIKGEMLARIESKKEYHNVEELVNYFCVRAHEVLGYKYTENEKKQFITHICKLVSSMRYQAKWISKVIPNSTKVVLSVGAGYSHYYIFNKMLREHGITSIEIQHGYVSSNNIMYNYGDAIVSDSRIKNGMPDYIFTYGDWWSNQINCPIKKISIGNPYHDFCINNLGKKSNKQITVMGIGENTENYLKLTNFLSKSFGDHRVIFRPHPGEFSMITKLMRNINFSVVIDNNVEVYDTISESSIIVGEVSTVLFEAIGIVDRIIVWDTDYTRTYLPKHPFETFSSFEELKDIISKPSTTLLDVDDYWEKNWKQKYIDFITSGLQIGI